VWSTGQTSSSIPVSGGLADSIFVDVTDYCGSLVADSFAVIIPPPILFPDDVRTCLGQTESISPVGGAVPYTVVFNTDSLIVDNTAITPLFTGFYTINYVDACGLTGSTLLEVVVCETEIPNIFSPNGDGVNDVFIIQGSEGFPRSRFEVFNRWGGLVYENDNYQSAWRGDDLAEGTYYYVYHRNDGVKFAGYFQLVR
jgi:gliding motility-associated-like protein